MLLKFSRRAAAEMSRRVERIVKQVLPDQGWLMIDALNWSGTFHAIGARLLREYASDIGLDPAFSIHDRATAKLASGSNRKPFCSAPLIPAPRSTSRYRASTSPSCNFAA